MTIYSANMDTSYREESAGYLPGRNPISRFANRHRRWLLALPAMAFVAILLVFPVVYTLYLSFTDAEGSVRADKELVGIDNYVSVLTDTTRFWPAVARTVGFTGVVLFFEVLLGMGIALLLWRGIKGQGLIRVTILLPLVATPVAVAMMWRLILDPNIGAANQFLQFLNLPPQPWFENARTALPTAMMIDIWQWTPMVALILLTGLTSLPDEPQEAAMVDGASNWQRFRYVTLPMLRPTIIIALLLRGIDALKTFDLLYATLGKGGGSYHSLETLNVYAYSLSFDYQEFARSSTVLILFFVIIVGCMFVLTKKGNAR